MKIIFFGTGKFGVPTLKCLLNSEYEVIAVVTQPDRAKGRGYNVLPTPVKAYVEKAAPGVAIFQPEDSRSNEFLDMLKDLDPELFVVVDYGQKLSNGLLELPEKYAINLHPSLLPEYRGASPINKAILDGKTTTGNTVFKMAEKMDAGDIILQDKIEILPEETAVELSAKLSLKGAELVVEAVGLISENKEKLISQKENNATYAHKINKKDGQINWQNNALHIINKTRAFQPWPGAFTYLNGKMLKIISADIYDGDEPESVPGQLIDNKMFLVTTGKGVIMVKCVQLEGKKAMSADDFIRGLRLPENIILG